MFGREFKAAEHRQHMRPPTSPGYTFERVGTEKVADRWVLDEIANASGMVTPLRDGWEIIISSDGPVLHKEMDANGYDGAAVTPPSAEGGPWGWRVNARLFQVHVGSGSANSAEEAMAACEETYAAYKRTASRKTAAPLSSVIFDSFSELLSSAALLPEEQKSVEDAYEAAELGKWEAAYNLIDWVAGGDHGPRIQKFLETLLDDLSGQGATASRTAAGKCQKCDGMGRETYETDTGSLSTQTCTACGGTGQAKEAARRTSAVTWYDQSDQFGGMWSTYQGSAPDSPNGQISESHGTYRWYVSDSGTRGNQQTGESSSLEDAKREAESVLSSLGVTASRTASHRTAFLDTVELTEPRHRVAGWDWQDQLNGFVAAEAAREFTCACGDNVPAPGYTDCRCGKRWNCYSISANGSKKMIAREVPVRENVVMARTASRRTAETIDSENLQVGDVVKYGDETITIIGEQEYWEDPFGRDMMKYMARSSDGREGYVMFGYGASLPVVASTRTASRKTAAPSSGADAIAQHFPGWRVDDENGNFWEIQSPGGEHAFIHEEDGTYTLLMDDNTPDEFYVTGLSFEDALAEVRAEGII